MKSSDQRYFQVQRTKRDTASAETLNKRLVLALRDARLDWDHFPAVEAAIRDGAAEWSHILLACGWTANDFRRNYRRGSPSWHVVTVNSLAEIDMLRPERLDGYSLLRLSREQTKNVKLRWAKLRPHDFLIHDPQGDWWTKIMEAWLEGKSNDHLDLLRDLRAAGISLVEKNTRSEQGNEARIEKELYRSLRSFEHGINDGQETPPEVMTEIAISRFEQVLEYLATGKCNRGDDPAIVRLAIEEGLIIAEAWATGGNIDKAIWNGDTSQRHCSDATLRKRIAAVQQAVDQHTQISTDFNHAA